MPPRLRARFIVAVTFVSTLLICMNYFISTPLTTKSWPTPQFQKSTLDWSSAKQYHAGLIGSPTPVAAGRSLKFPPVQHNFGKNYHDDNISKDRRKAVREAFVRSWKSYKEQAWLHDELRPVSGGFKDPFGGWAATLVDCMDTLWLMDLKDDFYEAAGAAVKMDWSNTTATAINLFETTIRHLGGLLSAYDLSGESALLLKATELGDMLYIAFDTPNRIPGFWLDFEKAKDGLQIAGNHDPSAGPTSLSLEFSRLSQLTGDNKYYDATLRISKFLEITQQQSKLPGMWPAMIDFENLNVLGDNSFTLGALADSLYEYLPKMAALLGSKPESDMYEGMYRKAMDTVIRHVLFRPMLPDRKNILFAGTTFVHDDGIHLVPEGQHLACFAGGMFALGGRLFNIDEHVDIGERLTRGCAWAYQSFPTGLMPEIFALVECKSIEGCEWDEEIWKRDGDPKLKPGFRHARDPRYLLRPEAIESIFILYRITGKEEFRNIAWKMFQSTMKATSTRYANSAIRDVTVDGETEKDDSMESFWLSETLKYFYLIFSPPSLVSLDEFVLNTEAHPFKRPV